MANTIQHIVYPNVPVCLYLRIRSMVIPYFVFLVSEFSSLTIHFSS